jgi:CheY-like chemotaxis protein
VSDDDSTTDQSEGLPSDRVAEPAGPARILVVEDESIIRIDIVESLRGFGYDVVGEAADGEAAVAMATELRPDLVVMDVKMPKMDGISAAEKLHQGRIAPVLLLTAFSQKELVERASERGPAVARRAERHELFGVIDVGSEFVIRRDERRNVDEVVRLRGLTRSGCHARQFATAGNI